MIEGTLEDLMRHAKIMAPRAYAYLSQFIDLDRPPCFDIQTTKLKKKSLIERIVVVLMEEKQLGGLPLTSADQVALVMAIAVISRKANFRSEATMGHLQYPMEIGHYLNLISGCVEYTAKNLAQTAAKNLLKPQVSAN